MLRRAAIVLICAAAIPAAAQQVNPVSWRASITPAEVAPGGEASIHLDAAIDAGWHVYSATQPAGGPLATVVELIENENLQRAGELRQSRFETKHDAVFNIKVEAFTDRAWFEVPVRARSSAPAGAHEALVRVSYQACTGRICLPPAEPVLTVKYRIGKVTPKASPPATAPAVAVQPEAAPNCAPSAGVRALYEEIAHLLWADPDRHRERIACVPAALSGEYAGEDAYYAAMLWLRFDRHDPSPSNREKAASLLSAYVSGREPRLREESALANLVSALAALRRFDEAKTRYEELRKKYLRRSSSHEQWADSTNVSWAGSALLRSLLEAKDYAAAESVAREHLQYLQERESSLAWSYAAESSRLLQALEEQGKTEDATAYRKELETYFAQHAEKYPAAADFWLTTARVRQLERANPAAALAALEGKREVYRKAGFERSYDQSLARLRLYDNAAPPLEADLWINSEGLTLEKLRGKVVLLDFWASWCMPCRKDFPALEELSKTRRDDGLVVVGVTQNDRWFMTFDGKTVGRGESKRLSWQEEMDLLGQFVKDFKMTMPVAAGRRPENPKEPFANSPLMQPYGIQAFPTTVLIDRQGIVRFVGDREGEQYESTLARLLSEPATE